MIRMISARVLIAGVLLLIIGIGVVALSASNTIPNVEHFLVDWWNLSNPVLEAIQLQTREYLLFEHVFDHGEKVHVDIRGPGPSHNADDYTRLEWEQKFTLDVYVKNSENTTLKHESYASPRAFLQEYSMDILFETPEHGTYRIYVVYKTWLESHDVDQEEWSFANWTGLIDAYLKADIDVQKTTANLILVIGGISILTIGVGFISMSIIRRRK